MAPPLTKTKAGGELYTRPFAVEAQIDQVICLSRSDLQTRLLIVDRDAPDYLCSECLVHLVREGRRSDDQQLMSAVLPVLLGRCEANLLVTVPDGEMPDAASLRQEILEDLTDLFVTDGMGDFPDELDFYECRFNKAFKALRIDAVRRDIRRRKRDITVVDLLPSEAASEPCAYEDAFARVSDAFKILPTQEWDVFREPFAKAIEGSTGRRARRRHSRPCPRVQGRVRGSRGGNGRDAVQLHGTNDSQSAHTGRCEALPL